MSQALHFSRSQVSQAAGVPLSAVEEMVEDGRLYEQYGLISDWFVRQAFGDAVVVKLHAKFPGGTKRI